MKLTHLVLMFAMLAVLPADAATIHAHRFAPQAKSAVVEEANRLVIDNRYTALPLECRGYYVQPAPHKARINRCE